MSKENIQHKSIHPAPVHIGFDDKERPVPVCWPEDQDAESPRDLDDEEETRIRIETIRVLLEELLKNSDGTAADLGQKTMFLAHRLKIPGAPETQAELGQSIGRTAARANQLLKIFNELAIFNENPLKNPAKRQ